MKRWHQICLFSFTALASSMVLAHDQALAVGFYEGFLHPLTGLDHLAALILVGMMIGRMASHRVLAMGGMMAALFTGIVAAMMLGGQAWVEAAVLCSLPVFLGLQWIKGAGRDAVAFVVMGLFLIAHGWTHGMVLSSMNTGFVLGVMMSSLIVMVLSVRMTRVIDGRPVKAHA